MVQVECAQNIWNLLQGSKLAQLHEDEVGLEDDRYLLRQDRYPLRTAPQFLGPQVEDILSALAAITQECNSSKYLFPPDSPFLLSPSAASHRQPFGRGRDRRYPPRRKLPSDGSHERDGENAACVTSYRKDFIRSKHRAL